MITRTSFVVPGALAPLRSARPGTAWHRRLAALRCRQWRTLAAEVSRQWLPSALPPWGVLGPTKEVLGPRICFLLGFRTSIGSHFDSALDLDFDLDFGLDFDLLLVWIWFDLDLEVTEVTKVTEVIKCIID